MEKKVDGRTVRFDWDILNRLIAQGACKTSCADIMDVSQDTIERKIKAKFNCGWKEYRERKMSKTRVALTQKAISLGLGGNVVMLIFCLKNLCDWRDKNEVEVQSITNRIKEEEKIKAKDALSSLKSQLKD